MKVFYHLLLAILLIIAPSKCFALTIEDAVDTANTVIQDVESGDLDIADPADYMPDNSDPALTLPAPNNNYTGHENNSDSSTNEPDITDPYANAPDNSDPALTLPPPPAKNDTANDPELSSPYAAQLERQLQDITDDQEKVYVETINQDGPDKQKAAQERERQKAEARKNEEDAKINCFAIDGKGKYCNYPGIERQYQENIKAADEDYINTVKAITDRTAYFTKALATLRAAKR